MKALNRVSQPVSTTLIAVAVALGFAVFNVGDLFAQGEVRPNAPTGASVTVTGLSAGTKYISEVWSYSGGSRCDRYSPVSRADWTHQTRV